MFMVNLDESALLNRKFWFFGYNRFNVFSFYDRDHCKSSDNRDKRSAREKLESYLYSHGIYELPEKVMLLTHLRVFGYVFNPVSFYYCYNENDDLYCVVAEVTNTYGEMKMYLVNEKKGKWFTASHHKLFYISPFTELDDYLNLKVGQPDEKLKVFIDDYTSEEVKVKTALIGSRKALTNLRLIKYALRFPLITLQIISLIHWQALKLWIKGVKFIPKNENLHLQRDIHYKREKPDHAEYHLQKNSLETVGQNEAGQA
jgi:DUF1365 family protein